MNILIRNFFIGISLLTFLIAFSPSYNSLNIDNLAYVIGIGIDYGENEKFKISFQFAPKSSEGSSESGSNSGSTESQNNSSIINTVEAPSIETAINLMNSYLAKKINLSHCKIIVFSEEVAYNGISDEIYTLINNSEIRKSTSIVVSKCPAKTYLEDSSPILENIITRYYDIFPYSSKYTGYVYNATIGDFFNNLSCNYCEPTAILGGINNSNNEDFFNKNDKSIENSKSSDNLFQGLRDSQNIGLAVFKDDKLVGELTASETLCYCIVKGELHSFMISIPDPDDENKKLDLTVFPKDKRKIDIKIINNTPYIKFSNEFIGRINTMDRNSNYLDEKKLNEISDYANKYLTDLITNYLYKTSLEFKSDINEFGTDALSNFLTLKEFDAYNWQNSYSDSIFKVDIKTTIESSILVTET